MKPVSPQLMLLVAAAALAAACGDVGKPATGGNGVTMVPLSPSPSTSAPPVATPTPSASPTTAAGESPPAGVPTDPPGTFFHETFDGTALDPKKWIVHEKGGVVLVKDGAVDLLTGGTSASFPLLIAAHDMIPKSGPFYVEVKYKVVTAGRPVSMVLDYVPPPTADDEGPTAPFMFTATAQAAATSSAFLTAAFRVNTNENVGAQAANGFFPGRANRWRLEFDGRNAYRFIVGDEEVKTFTSVRRPWRFWAGAYPNKVYPASAWMRLSLDEIETGTLTTPDPAKPPAAVATPTPPASTPTPPGASPSAGPSPT